MLARPQAAIGVAQRLVSHALDGAAPAGDRYQTETPGELAAAAEG